MPSQRHDCAAICTPGLEPFVEAELRALKLKPRSSGSGVVPFSATNRQLYAANLWLRTASRVLIRIARFKATDFAHLQSHAAGIDWDQWIPEGHAPEFRVSATKSKLYHTDAITQRLHQVVGPPSIGEPTQPFVVRIDRDIVSVSVDSGGTPLNHRGWRTDLGVAPLRPTMAAAVVQASGWPAMVAAALDVAGAAGDGAAGDGAAGGGAAFVDPFAGSGTIPIEAALLALDLPPGGARRFAFQLWDDFEPGTWASVTGEAAGRARSVDDLRAAGVRIEASDRDAGAVAAIAANAERAGVAELIDVAERVVSDLGAAPAPGVIATNPPYGKRVGDGDLRPLYQRFGFVAREQRPGSELVVVAADRELARSIDRRLKPLGGFGHGGTPVSVLGCRLEPEAD